MEQPHKQQQESSEEEQDDDKLLLRKTNSIHRNSNNNNNNNNKNGHHHAASKLFSSAILVVAMIFLLYEQVRASLTTVFLLTRQESDYQDYPMEVAVMVATTMRRRRTTTTTSRSIQTVALARSTAMLSLLSNNNASSSSISNNNNNNGDGADNNNNHEKESSSLLYPSSIFDLSIERSFLPIPENRSDRFPSIEERIKLYMGDWYLPPCTEQDKIPYYYTYNNNNNNSNNNNNNNNSNTKHNNSWPMVHIPLLRNSSSSDDVVVVDVDSIITSDQTILLEKETLQDCSRRYAIYQKETRLNGGKPSSSDERILKRKSMNWYCADVLDFFELVQNNNTKRTNKNSNNNNNNVPVLVHFGDSQADQPFPVVAKFRTSRRRQRLSSSSSDVETASSSSCISRQQQNDTITSLSPILWQLNKKRHWYPLNWLKMRRRHPLWNNRTWEKKRDQALWLGAFTGGYEDFLANDDEDYYYSKNNNSSSSSNYTSYCRRNLRCNFVLQHINSTLIEARFTDLQGRFQNQEEEDDDDDDDDDNNSTTNRRRRLLSLPDALLQQQTETMGMKQMMDYKILISLEGNDIASGLKWQLYSDCLVMMPIPKLTSWAMEELLEPWIHYIPIYRNGTNAEQMVLWALEHPYESKQMIQRSTTFIQDLIFHENEEEDEVIRYEMAKRYHQHWTT